MDRTFINIKDRGNLVEFVKYAIVGVLIRLITIYLTWFLWIYLNLHIEFHLFWVM